MFFEHRHVALTALILTGAFGASGQITVTAPAVNETIRAADDYATQTFQDPWDMSQWTDLGWFTFGVDSPPANLSNISFTNGVFSTTTGSVGNFWLLDPNVPGSAPIGKIGSVFPIDSTKYRRFLIRMNLSGGTLTNPPPADQYAYFIWNLYGSQSTSSAFPVYSGQWIYSVDIPTLGSAAGPAWTSAPVTSLRFDPLNKSGINVSVDWARLVSSDATLLRTITWNGSGPVDIFLDNDTNFANGYAGQIATGATGNSFQFYVGGLSAGTYYVAIRPTGSSSTPAYSAGAWTVNDIPTLTFTSPSPEGSADDFATTQLGNPWDMDAVSDIDFTVNVSGLSITNIAARDEAGNSLGSVRVLNGTATNSDPEVFPLYSTIRGATKRIDTNRYRILTLKWGLAGKGRDIAAGSVGRIVWKLSTESVENVSDDLILNHLPDANVIQTISADMKTLQLETDPGGSPSHSGWTGLLDSFRIKPDEFSTAVNFYVQSIKLTAFEQADASYTIRWNYSNLGAAAPTLQFFWDATGAGFNGTQIVAGLTPTAGTYTWNTSALANGTYYIYARIVNGGTVMNQTYARWPIVVQHGVVILPTLSLDRSQLNFGVTTNGAAVTSSQTIHVATAAGVAWNVASNQSFVTVSPASGTGPGSFTVSVQSGGLTTPGNLQANVAVTSSGVSNSPQNVLVNVNVLNPSSVTAPFGSFDTPTNNITGIAGAIPITGWALDQIEVTNVDILREPIVGEPAGTLVFIGTAVFVADARPDVQGLYPTLPFNYRAGWGYQMLTNFLPNASGSGAPGNGTYKIHAIAHDKSGLATDLGTKTIGVDNAHASKPFGTLDTPTQGGTISGSDYVNFGWALTQQPFMIPTDGSTITVVIDGVTVGHPTYNQYRSDIANLFPGYANSMGAVGFFHINTTTLANGVHTISWNVFDNGGRGDGIGSRYFNVFNSGGPVAEPEEPGIAKPETVTIRRGIHPDREAEALSPDDGGRYVVSMEELGRIELRLGAMKGYLMVSGERHALPLGSTLKNGVFHWQAGVGYLGQYELLFEQAGGGTVGVWVTIAPKSFQQ
ncbi:MAG TPA: hypothetical protein VIX89_04325 [Bryobacteraceae bacterium]